MDKNNYDIRAIFEKMELELISSMKRAFYFHKREEEKEGFSWEQWQLSKLRAIDKYRKENKRIIDSYSEPIQECIDRELQGNFKKGKNRVSKAINKIAAFLRLNKGSVNIPEDTSEQQKVREYIAALTGRKPRVPQEESFFGVNEKKLNSLQDTVTNDINKASHAVLRKMDDIYRQTIFKAETYMSAGVKTLNQAVDMATKELLMNGINCVEYKNGRRVNIASYAEMALRTASQRATFLGEGSKRDEWGIYTVVVSAHANTCEMCLPWQGQVLIDDVFSHPSQEYLEENKGKYKLLSEAIEAGLLHPNCRHTLTTFFPGITQIPEIPDEEEALSNYKAEQYQRYIERQIRRWKRLKAGACDSETFNMADMKVKQWQEMMRKHIKDNPQLRRDRIREELLEVPENKIKKLGASLKEVEESAKIEETRNKILNNDYNTKIREQKQNEHILCKKQWLKRARESIAQDKIPQSAFDKDTNIQELIDTYKGKGIIEFRGKDEYPREYVEVDKEIGVAYNRELKKYIRTNRIAIHYSSKGVHAYPVNNIKNKGGDKVE